MQKVSVMIWTHRLSASKPKTMHLTFQRRTTSSAHCKCLQLLCVHYTTSEALIHRHQQHQRSSQRRGSPKVKTPQQDCYILRQHLRNRFNRARETVLGAICTHHQPIGSDMVRHLLWQSSTCHGMPSSSQGPFSYSSSPSDTSAMDPASSAC